MRKHVSAVTAFTIGVALLAFTTVGIRADDFWISKGSGSSPRRVLSGPAVSAKPAAKPKRKLKDRLPVEEQVDVPGKALASAPEKVDVLPPRELKVAVGDSGNGDVKSAEPKAAEPKSAESIAPTGSYGATYSNPVRRKWRVGVVIQTRSKPIVDVLARIPIPQDWPEQQVEVFKNEVPANFQIEQVEQLDGLRRLVLHGRSIEARQTVLALMTYVVTTRCVNPPADTSVLQLPNSKDREVKKFLATSAGINFRNKKLRKQAEELWETADTDWERIKAIYSWVRDNIDQLPEDSRAQHFGAQAAFVKRQGYTEDLTGLFIAMCRAVKAPARMVFVDGTPSAEFMLRDPDDQLHWFPCDVAGLAAFGRTIEPKLILQKGDSIKVPGEKGRRKFVPATGVCKGISGTVRPDAMKFVREPLPMEAGQ